MKTVTVIGLLVCLLICGCGAVGDPDRLVIGSTLTQTCLNSGYLSSTELTIEIEGAEVLRINGFTRTQVLSLVVSSCRFPTDEERDCLICETSIVDQIYGEVAAN